MGKKKSQIEKLIDEQVERYMEDIREKHEEDFGWRIDESVLVEIREAYRDGLNDGESLRSRVKRGKKGRA